MHFENIESTTIQIVLVEMIVLCGIHYPFWTRVDKLCYRFAIVDFRGIRSRQINDMQSFTYCACVGHTFYFIYSKSKPYLLYHFLCLYIVYIIIAVGSWCKTKLYEVHHPMYRQHHSIPYQTLFN